MRKLTQEEVLQRLYNVFGDKYGYSEVRYSGSTYPIYLICPEHGMFSGTTKHLFYGHGCPYCVNRYISTEDYVQKAKQVHPEYSYEKTKYVNNHTDIIVTCPIHGDFPQNPDWHLRGGGCPKCNGGVVSNKEEFAQKADEIHHGFYDYSLFNYVNAKTKGKIICPRHGIFPQPPDQHLRGQGCPKCKSSKLENMIITILQKNQIRFIFQAHIGLLGKKTIDFYLPDYQIAIECQGEQHFTDTKFGSKIAKVSDRIALDEEKYNECKANNIDVIYFTVPEFFNDKSINVNIQFYNDKTIFQERDKLLGYIKTQPYSRQLDKWDELRDFLFEKIPNIIETNHGFLYRNRLLVLDNTSFKKDSIIQYYKKRKVLTRWVDATIEKKDFSELLEWLNRPLLIV